MEEEKEYEFNQMGTLIPKWVSDDQYKCLSSSCKKNAILHEYNKLENWFEPRGGRLAFEKWIVTGIVNTPSYQFNYWLTYYPEKVACCADSILFVISNFIQRTLRSSDLALPWPKFTVNLTPEFDHAYGRRIEVYKSMD